MPDGHLKGRAYNGLNGYEVKTLVFQQLALELQKQRDPCPGVDWRKQIGAQIDRELSLDNSFAIHIIYPVVEWAWLLVARGDHASDMVSFVFELKLNAYPVDNPEITAKVEGRIAPRQKPKDPGWTPGVVEDFEQRFSYGQAYEAPDALRRRSGLTVPGSQPTDQGRVDLTVEQTDAMIKAPAKALQSF